MKRIVTSSAVLALMFGAAPAMAECNIGQTTQYTKQDEAVQALGARRDLRELRNAAMILNTYGKEDACQNVVAAIEDIRSNRGQPVSQTNQQTGQSDQQMTGRANEQSGDGQQVQSVNYQQMMSDAKPVSELGGRLTVDRMMDADVRGANGQVVGEISDVVLSSEGQPSHAVVAFGGFLGLAEDRVAIPFGKLRMQTNVNDTDSMVFFVPMNEQQLQNAPRVQEDDDSWFSNEDWVSQNEDYYEKNTIES